MSQLLIEVPEENVELLLALLPKLNSRVVSKIILKSESSESPVEILKRMAARGGVKEFGDASEWQRETRQDRPLANREE